MILVDLHNKHLKIRKSRSRVFKRLPVNRRGQSTTQVSWLPKQQLSLELHSTRPKYNWRSVLVKHWVLNISVVIGKSFSLFICNYYNTSWVILLIFPVRVTKTILWCISHTRVLWIFQNRLLKKSGLVNCIYTSVVTSVHKSALNFTTLSGRNSITHC